MKACLIPTWLQEFEKERYVMTKQEEIREAIDIYTDGECLYPNKDCLSRSGLDYCRFVEDAYKCLMERLTKIGVVITTRGFYSDLMEPLIKE